MTAAAWLEGLLARHWWRPHASWLARLLSPLAAAYGVLARRQRNRALPWQAPLPLVVVGNFVVGGAGKTPTVIALVQALAAHGRHPGVISRGHGRPTATVREVAADDTAAQAGDEPLLIRRRTGAPVFVGSDRVAVAQALCARYPEVDVLVADDGLQHHALARDAELVVFDERGAGNGLLLPAGPLREPLPLQLTSRMRVLYTAGSASSPLPGALAERRLAQAWPLHAWHAGDDRQVVTLATLRGRLLVAAAGLAAPEKFYTMLEAAGLTIRRLPLPDHHGYATLPWPVGTPEVITTEKDAIKLAPDRLGATHVWVVPLDLRLPDALVSELIALLFPTNRP